MIRYKGEESLSELMKKNIKKLFLFVIFFMTKNYYLSRGVLSGGKII